jgi:hypothetical protein
MNIDIKRNRECVYVLESTGSCLCPVPVAGFNKSGNEIHGRQRIS